MPWQSLLNGALHVKHGALRPRDVELLDEFAARRRVGGVECSFALSEKDADCLDLPPQLISSSGQCARPPFARWRANEQAVGWHQDGNGHTRTDAILGLKYLEGSCRLSLRVVAEPHRRVDVDCQPGTIVIFDNVLLEHCVLSNGYRSFLGPFLAAQPEGAIPCALASRGGELCCSRGEETCCGNMCWMCRARHEEQERRQRAPLTLCHAFTYCRRNVPDARIELVEQLGERRVVFNGGQAHGSWNWLIHGNLEISFNANPWKWPRKKVFEWKKTYWLSKQAAETDDLTWQVTLLPCEDNNCLLRRSHALEASSLSSSSAADGSWRPNFGSRDQREEPGAPIANSLCDGSSSLEDDLTSNPYNASSSDSDDANLAEWMALHTLGATAVRGEAVEATHNFLLLRRSPAPGATSLSSSSAADGS